MGVIIKSQRRYIRSIIHYQRGGLLFLSALTSTVIMTGCTQLSIYGLDAKIIIDGVSIKELSMPILIEIIGIIFYVGFLLVDFVTGISASRHEYYKRGGDDTGTFLRTDRLYKTFWKLLGVILLSCLIGSLGVFSIVMAQTWAYKSFMWVQIVILISACLYEFQSIGDNIERRTGSKPPIFIFIGTLFLIFKRRVLEKAAGTAPTKGNNSEATSAEDIERELLYPDKD